MAFVFLTNFIQSDSLYVHSCLHAKSLQSCLTLCNPMDCKLSGSSDHGILQARKYWNGLPCPPAGDHYDPGIFLTQGSKEKVSYLPAFIGR